MPYLTCYDRPKFTAKTRKKKIQNQQKYSNDNLATFLMSKVNSKTRFLYELFEENPKKPTFRAMQRHPKVTFQ